MTGVDGFVQLNIGYIGAACGLGLVIIGASLGIGLIGKAAMSAISKQPEISEDIKSSMIIVSALIEGVALFAVIICMLLAINKDPEMNTMKLFCSGLGAGLVVFGASIGISFIGSSAMNGIARQPESSSKIKSSMIINAALVEGVALFGVIICLILTMK